MPRGLIILVLLLLVGSYFLFFSRGRSELSPSLTLSPTLKEGQDGFIVVLDGSIESEKECEVNGIVYISDNGMRVSKREFGPSKFSGSYPLPTLAFTTTHPVSVGAEVTAKCDKDTYFLTSETEVPVPDPKVLLLLPNVSFVLNSVEGVGTTRDVHVGVVLHNPNDQDVQISDLSVKINGSSAALSSQQITIPAHGSKEVNALTSVSSETITIQVSGKVHGYGTEKEFNASGKLTLPPEVKKPVVVDVSLKSINILPDSLDLSLGLTLRNPNQVSVAPVLVIRFEKGELKQEVNLGKIIVPAAATQSLSKEIKVSPAVVGGVGKVLVDGEERESFPIVVSPLSTLITPPQLEVSLEGNTVTLEVNNQWDHNIQVKDVTFLATLVDGSQVTQNFGADPVTVESTKDFTYTFAKEVSKVSITLYWGLSAYDFWEKLTIIAKAP